MDENMVIFQVLRMLKARYHITKLRYIYEVLCSKRSLRRRKRYLVKIFMIFFLFEVVLRKYLV